MAWRIHEWLNTPLTKLFNSLARSEAPKLPKIKPARYLLAISNPLSRTDKMKLCEIFSPYIKSPADIFGKEDLNDILAKHQEIERQHYKLWIASSNVLSSIINAPIHGRSDFLIQDVVDDSIRYVATKNHDAAITKLESKHVIIITGEAGIGKTTLARNILLPYLAEGYELFSVAESIIEVEGVFKKNSKQIFYFDDFLGSNYLDAISGNSGAQIANFIKRVKADKLKRFVLTSRTTILNQGKIHISALASQNTSKDEYEVSLQSLSRLDKAKILYNHIWHSGLSDELKEEIYKERRYRAVVDHKNYNPRIISYVTDSQRLEGVLPAKYWAHISRMLDNPSDVWGHPFDAQHDDYGRSLVVLVALNGRSILQRDLSEAYYRYVSYPRFSSMRGQQDFLLNLRLLCGSMLNRVVSGARESLTLFNPSIRDFVIARYREDPVVMRLAFQALRTDDSIFALSGLMKSSHVDEVFVRNLLLSIACDADDSDYVDYSPSYIARLYLFIKEIIDPEIIKRQLPLANVVEFIEREDLPPSFEEILEFFLFARELGFDVPKSISRLVEQGCEREPSTYELERLAEIMAIRDCSEDVINLFRQSIYALFSEQVHEEFPAEDVFGGSMWDGSLWEAKLKLNEMISKRLDSFGLAEDDELVADIADKYDLDDQAHGYFVGRDEFVPRASGRPHRSMDVTDDIDDLFDRS